MRPIGPYPELEQRFGLRLRGRNNTLPSRLEAALAYRMRDQPPAPGKTIRRRWADSGQVFRPSASIRPDAIEDRRPIPLRRTPAIPLDPRLRRRL